MTIQDEVYPDHEGFGFYPGGDNTRMRDTYIYNWVFHFNEFTGLWSAIPRDIYNQYWDNPNVDGVIRSKSIETLTEIIRKTKGEIGEIEKIIDAK
jgi:hypothetical protein